MKDTQSKWFESWFDSKYYHILYQHRDDTEAQGFMDALIRKLDMKDGDHVMDLCCGKGRHAIYLASKGLDVIGVDLSPQSIEHAQQFAHEHLHFQTHDMRERYKADAFQFVLNLFTSFGYFEDPKEDQKAINAAISNLQAGGTFVLDFLNPTFVQQHLVASEEKSLDGINFQIQRSVKAGFIIKKIAFEDKGEKYTFEEKVRAIPLAQFKTFFANAGLTLTHVYGDYALNDFDEKLSKRMVLVGKKPQ